MQMPKVYQIELPDAEMVTLLRRQSPAERMRSTSRCWSAMRQWLARAVSSQHPQWTERQVGQEVCRRLLLGSD